MFVLIEGIDKTGKSTLSRELSKRLYYPVINRLKPKDNIFIECIDALSDWHEPMIIERFHASEVAYGPVKRGLIRFDFRQLKIIELYMRMLGTYNIYCTAPKEKLKDRFKVDDETFLTVDDIEPVLAGFEEFLNHETLLEWDNYVIGDSYDELAKKIAAKFTPDFIRRVEKFKEYRTIGNLEGSTLIVGEKYGDKLLQPLIPFGNNNPGLMLFEAIEQSMLEWNDIIITNAFKHGFTDKQNYEALRDELFLPKVRTVVCLGNNAYDAVLRALAPERQMDLFGKTGVMPRVIKITHPSGYYSYRSGTAEGYAELINHAYLGI